VIRSDSIEKEEVPEIASDLDPIRMEEIAPFASDSIGLEKVTETNQVDAGKENENPPSPITLEKESQVFTPAAGDACTSSNSNPEVRPTKSIAAIIELEEPKAPNETSEPPSRKKVTRIIQTASGLLVEKIIPYPFSNKKKIPVEELGFQKKDPPTQALPLSKLMEHYLAWFGEDETEDVLHADVRAVKEGKSLAYSLQHGGSVTPFRRNISRV